MNPGVFKGEARKPPQFTARLWVQMVRLLKRTAGERCARKGSGFHWGKHLGEVCWEQEEERILPESCGRSLAVYGNKGTKEGWSNQRNCVWGILQKFEGWGADMLSTGSELFQPCQLGSATGNCKHHALPMGMVAAMGGGCSVCISSSLKNQMIEISLVDRVTTSSHSVSKPLSPWASHPSRKAEWYPTAEPSGWWQTIHVTREPLTGCNLQSSNLHRKGNYNNHDLLLPLS